MKWLLLIALLFSTPSRALSTDTEHLMKHVGFSAAINIGVYSWMHWGLGAPKIVSAIAANFVSLLAGFTYKYMEQMNQTAPVQFGRPMLENAVGNLAATLVIIQF